MLFYLAFRNKDEVKIFYIRHYLHIGGITGVQEERKEIQDRADAEKKEGTANVQECLSRVFTIFKFDLRTTKPNSITTLSHEAL